jgi:osmotically-inducible protein OsmY
LRLRETLRDIRTVRGEERVERTSHAQAQSDRDRGIGVDGRVRRRQRGCSLQIHIIVKNLRVTLLGVVDNESDKTIAGMRAREAPGAMAVENDLIVENAKQTSKQTSKR